MRERNIFFYESIKTSSYQTHFKPEGKLERENPKKTIFVSDVFELLQMILEPYIEGCASEEAKPQKRVKNIEGCASEEAEPQRRVNTRQCASKNAGSRTGGFGGPTSIGEGNECQQGYWTCWTCWVQEGMDCKIPYRLRRRT